MTKELQMIVVAAVIFALITGGLAWWGNGLAEEVAAQDARLLQLNQDIAKAQKEIDKKPMLEKEQQALDKHLARYVTILPPPELASREWFLRVVQEKCERSQMVASLVRFVEDSKAKAKQDPKAKAGPTFEEIKVDLVATGTYDQFLRFLNSIERHETFLRVNTFDCRLADSEATADEEGNLVWKLEIRLQISTYRYRASKAK